MNPFLVLLSFLVSSFCFSQRTITGTVTGPDGDEIIGVVVSVKESSEFTETDFDGKYSIEASPEDVLVFSYAGYDTQEVVVGDQNVIDVKMTVELDCYLPIYRPNILSLDYGFNYKTYGISFQNKYRIHSEDFNFNSNYSTNFDRNSNIVFGVEKGIRLSENYIVSVNALFETSDFNSFQYHSYKLNIGKSLQLFSKLNHEEAELLIGYVNYDGLTESNNFGYGLGLEKSISSDFKVGSSFIHWQEFNEFNANASYIWRRWSISGNYKHLARYEEFQVGLGYWFYF